MKKDDVKIGETYRAKVSDRLTTIRIDAEHTDRGWSATNLSTGKKVRIKSAQRLRGPATVSDRAKTKKPAKKKLSAAELKARHKADQENAQLRDERDAAPDGMTASERAMAESEKPAADAKTRKKRDGLSCLDAAAKVLEDAGEPMNTKAMVESMMAKGYWTTDAPTPSATLYSAILRELQKKGDDARFTKVERGKFTLAGIVTNDEKEG
ncbi:MAG: winged helix-turn-helix domain-containing protein [Phycisphaeraceae bacterium]